jgi:hypothetical protein
MTQRVRIRTWAATSVAAALSAAVWTAPAASARQGGNAVFKVASINVAGAAGVPANAIVEMTFTAPVDPASATAAVVQVCGRNATNTGYTRQVFGSLQVASNVVRFYPRLPGHLRRADGTFFPEGSPEDDAAANAGFQPSTGYQVRVIGAPAASPLRSVAGRPLKTDAVARFTVASNARADELWTTGTYADAPPPAFSFSNPPDRVPSKADQFTARGGAVDVPTKTSVALFCTKVPLAPGTARIEGNVDLTMTSRRGDASERRPVAGSVFVEQNFDTTRLEFQPRVALADQATYRLRVGKGVKDLTEQSDFASNPSRERLRTIYDFLAAGRALSPGGQVADLPDPPDELVPDWPPFDGAGGSAQRAVYKANILALGDAYPDEIDPRTMVMFTTRDEPVTDDSVTIEFTRSENLVDDALTTGTVDTDVPSAAAAIFTAAAGSGADGDLAPSASQTISSDSYAGATMNFRRVSIPPGVTVTLVGSRPAVLKSVSFSIEGTISADGAAGQSSSKTASTSPITSQSNQAGGAGGPGGGGGGNSSTSLTPGTGLAGNAGTDGTGAAASAQDGGRPGQGGQMASFSATYAVGGGGGGGGGVRGAGGAGAASTAPIQSWNGSGGAGGAAALGNDDLSPLVGGAGGAAGANGSWLQGQWATTAGAGGGGGGALMIQTAGTFTVGTSAKIRARGGAGGNGPGTGNSFPAGPGGGGGGGSLLLRTTKGFNVANPAAAFDVSGGLGGTQSGSSVAPFGGRGGDGLVRTEDPNGGIAIPGATSAVYSPTGAGVPSVVYTKFVDLGVQSPRVLPFGAADVVTVAQDDAILVEAQMTREDPAKLGKPDLSAITSSQDTSNASVMSAWTPVKLHDRTLVPGGAFGPVAGLPASHPPEYSGFSVDALNGRGYRFIRFRIRFQLDATQTATSPLPYVDRIVTHFQFNY